MNVVDSSAWLEYFADGPNAGYFEPAILATGDLIVPSITLYEVFKRMLEQRKEEAARDAVSAMSFGRIVDLGAELAIAAARFSHENRLPMADSIVITTARAFDAEIWTQDSDFNGLDRV
ncbi:MAG: type II toxin-antitoxin system VapC family toxin, partial [Chthoniobacterales bacterium]